MISGNSGIFNSNHHIFLNISSVYAQTASNKFEEWQ